MMERIPNLVIETYKVGEYIIEICKEKVMGHDTYGAYLQRDGYGTKEYMFGVSPGDESLDGFIELVEANLDEYIESYERSVE